MLGLEFVQIGYVTLVSVCVALLVLLASNWFFSTPRQSSREFLRESEGSFAFLFDEETLVNATPPARALLNRSDPRVSDWEAFLAVMSARFPDLREQLSGLAASGTMRITPDDGGQGAIEADFWDGYAQIRIEQPENEMGSSTFNPIEISALEDELEILRSLAEDAPMLIWKQDQGGTVTWANRAYMDRAQKDTGSDTWPPVQIFSSLSGLSDECESTTERVQLSATENQPEQWFDVANLKRGSGTIHFGVDANPAVLAETAQRSFVQTLTKTFANLSIGLAIFDKRRRLVLFNPALLDLTGLSAEFLIGQPTVQSLFDGLREAQILPEPKNYSSWRREVLDLEAAALDGTYHDTWNLPNGQTYRVTGRPHPDGAIAFLFEDISAEISLTRRFRSEIETGQAVIDAMEEAIAVFNAAGTMTMTNAALTNLWGEQNEMSLVDNTVIDMAQIWQSKTAPSPLWSKLREFTSGVAARQPVTEEILLLDGRQIECRLLPLFGGATMIGFRAITGGVKSAPVTEKKVTPEEILSATG